MDPVSQIIQAFKLTINPTKTEDIKQAEAFLDQVTLIFSNFKLISLLEKSGTQFRDHPYADHR